MITEPTTVLGPLTRQALLDASIPAGLLDRIQAGELEWTVEPEPAIGISGSEEAAAEMARAAAKRKDFIIYIRRTEAAQRVKDPYLIMPRSVYDAGVPTAVGQRIEATRRYEEALALRGGVTSDLFPPGKLEEWLTVATTESWDAVAFQFRQAADTLAASFSKPASFPTMVLLFLCRHHLELSLKSVIVAGEKLAGAVGGIPTKHKLRPLWDRALPLMKGSWAHGWDEAERGAAEAVIDEFEQVDESAMTTRYPVDKAGAAFSRPPLLASFSLSGFMNRFGQAADFIGGGALWIQVDLLTKNRPK